MLEGKNFLRPPGGWGFRESFIDDVKFRGFPSKVPCLPVSPWKKPSLVFSRPGMKAPLRISVSYSSPLQSCIGPAELVFRLQSIVCVCVCVGGGRGIPHDCGTCVCLRPQAMETEQRSIWVRTGHRASDKKKKKTKANKLKSKRKGTPGGF